MTYHYAYIGIKRLGAGQFYLINIKDKGGADYDGGKTYRLTSRRRCRSSNIGRSPPMTAIRMR